MVKNKNSGFTLVEVMISLSIILVIGFLAIPGAFDRDAKLDEVRGPFHTLQTDLVYMQSRALNGETFVVNGQRQVPDYYWLVVEFHGYTMGAGASVNQMQVIRKVDLAKLSFSPVGCVLQYTPYSYLPTEQNCNPVNNKVTFNVANESISAPGWVLDLGSGNISASEF